MDQRIKGIFISFEGGDGSGKTTQIKKLSQYLQDKKYEVVETLEPGDNSIGPELRSLILDPKRNIVSTAEIFLYLADRAQHTHEIIKPSLLSGKIVITDRFADATLAYQGYGRGLSIPLVEAMNHFATESIIPDLTFLLDLDPKKGKERTLKRSKNLDRLEQEKLDFHQKLRAGYLKIAEQDPERFRVIDSTQSIEKIFEIIKKEVDELL